MHSYGLGGSLPRAAGRKPYVMSTGDELDRRPYVALSANYDRSVQVGVKHYARA